MRTPAASETPPQPQRRWPPGQRGGAGAGGVSVGTALNLSRCSTAPPAPVSTVNVHHHTALLQREPSGARRTPHEDCCGYCERYCQGKITPTQRGDIEAWCQDVNTTMQAHKSKFSKKPKLRFLKANSSPSPTSEDGFMRLPSADPGQRWASSGISAVKQANRNGCTSGRRSAERQAVRPHTEPPARAPQASTHTNLASLAVQPSTSKWVEDHYGNNATQTKADASSRRAKSQPVTTRLHNLSFESVDSGEHSSHHSKVSSRTCSNELLNVITIDDATRHQRHRLLSRNHYRGGGSPSESRPHTSKSKHSADWAKRNYSHMVPPTDSQGQQSLRQVLYPAESGYETDAAAVAGPGEGGHEVVVRAIDNVVATREVLNNQAHRGLFKYDKTYSQPTAMHKESKRFQRMNNNLHKLMESQVLASSPLSVKIMQRSPSAAAQMEQREAAGSERGSPSRAELSPRLVGSTRQSGVKLNTPDTQFTTSRLLNSMSGKENFLEMLMDMEDN